MKYLIQQELEKLDFSFIYTNHSDALYIHNH